MDYKKQQTPTGNTVIWYEKDGVRISFADPSPGNSEYEAYLQWLSAGNVPQPWEG